MIYHKIIEQAAENDNFRKVLATTDHTQLVLMSIEVGDDIGEEVHEDEDQLLFFVDGEAKAVVDGREEDLKIGDIVLVPAGKKHNFINTGDITLKLFTTYSPAHHPEGTVHKTKADAEAAEY